MNLRLVIPALMVLASRAEAGCETCSGPGDCRLDYVCEFDPSWKANCCHLASDAGGPSCETAVCMDDIRCRELGVGWTCAGGCCAPPRCGSAVCDVDSNCAELGPDYRCFEGCCIESPPVCNTTCEALLDCQSIGSTWFCDTAVGCCVDLGGESDAGAPACRYACESLAGCSELGAGWICDTSAGCCVDLGGRSDSGPSCSRPCESLTGCSELGSGWICDTAAGCCIDTKKPDGGAPAGPPRRTTGSAVDRRSQGCGCGSTAAGPGLLTIIFALLYLRRR